VCGHAGGRYLADLWCYNLNKLAWAAAPGPAANAQQQQQSDAEDAALLQHAQQQQQQQGPPAAAGWSVTPLQDNKLLVMGGHTKAGKV
jgi:hypothetical protein